MKARYEKPDVEYVRFETLETIADNEDFNPDIDASADWGEW